MNDEWAIMSDFIREEIDNEVLRMLREQTETWFIDQSPINSYHESHKFLDLWEYQP